MASELQMVAIETNGVKGSTNTDENDSTESDHEFHEDSLARQPAQRKRANSQTNHGVKKHDLEEVPEDPDEPDYYRSIMAEFFGTLMLVFLITATVVFSGLNADSYSGKLSLPPRMTSGRHLLISLSAGLSYAVLLYGTMAISGGHLNPAITLSMMLTKKITASKGSLYIIAQLMGSLFGAGCTRACLPSIPDVFNHFGGARNRLMNSSLYIGEPVAWGIELLVSFMYVFIYFAAIDPAQARTNKHAGPLAPLAVGMAVLVGHCIAVPVTLCSLNPARSFGAAAMTGIWDDQAAYLIAPLIGGCVGGLLYTYAIKESMEEAVAWQLLQLENVQHPDKVE